MGDWVVSSVEVYKGFVLSVEYKRDYTHPSRCHRQCRVTYNGKSVAVGKTKKSIKDLIDSGAGEIWTR